MSLLLGLGENLLKEKMVGIYLPGGVRLALACSEAEFQVVFAALLVGSEAKGTHILIFTNS